MNTNIEDQDQALLKPITPEIVTRAQQGDEDALGTIYKRYRLDIYRYLYYRVGQMQAAEDLTSEVFERVIRAIQKSNFKNTSLEAWLFQIARNLAIDHYRKMSVRDHVPLDESLLSGDSSIDKTIEDQWVNDQLVQALKEVSDAQRDVIILRFAVSMPIAQVAQTLHRSEDSVKGLQRRGLMTIRNILSDLESNDA